MKQFYISFIPLLIVFLFGCSNSGRNSKPVQNPTIKTDTLKTGTIPPATHLKKNSPVNKSTANQRHIKEPKIPLKKITIEDLNLTCQLPENFKQAGNTIKAYNRQGKLLNKEIVFQDSTGNEIAIKWYAPDNASVIWQYYQQQFAQRKGNFALKAEKITVDGVPALFGISERRFDGKGHPLHPPAKVYFAVWMKNNALYEIYLRENGESGPGEAGFKKILASVQTQPVKK